MKRDVGHKRLDQRNKGGFVQSSVKVQNCSLSHTQFLVAQNCVGNNPNLEKLTFLYYIIILYLVGDILFISKEDPTEKRPRRKKTQYFDKLKVLHCLLNKVLIRSAKSLYSVHLKHGKGKMSTANMRIDLFQVTRGYYLLAGGKANNALQCCIVIISLQIKTVFYHCIPC